ncbi:MAG: response regulator [Sedimentisphaerales bacterium]|nr:response regulator [Sedimentisphaerales bacterium]
MKILLVDDSSTMRNIWKKTLRNIDDVEITEAEDGVQGLAAVDESGPFDLILLDWNMPNMDGITLLKKVREKKILTPVIMVTTEAEKTRIIEAIKAGANNYLVKPFTPDALQSKIQETVKKTAAPA